LHETARESRRHPSGADEAYFSCKHSVDAAVNGSVSSLSYGMYLPATTIAAALLAAAEFAKTEPVAFAS
jgi:hypothetical protein